MERTRDNLTPSSNRSSVSACPLQLQKQNTVKPSRNRIKKPTTTSKPTASAAIEGVDKVVFYKGQLCGTVKEYSDTLLAMLAKGFLAEKYKR